MRDQTDHPIANLNNTLIAVALCLSMPIAAGATDTSVLTPEAATMDATPSGSSGNESATASSETTTTILYGSAKKHLKPPDTTDAAGATNAPQNQPQELGVSDNGNRLQFEAATSDAITLYARAAKKFDAGQELSAEEYRSLGAGCIGYESDRTFFQKIARVSVVYKDSPAEKAGIRKGDKLIDIENDDDARANPSQPRQAVTCGQAGTPVDITVLRHGRPETLTLIRMNIEDIQESEYRHAWEQVVRRLGYPKEGTFSGTSLKNLKPRQ